MFPVFASSVAVQGLRDNPNFRVRKAITHHFDPNESGESRFEIEFRFGGVWILVHLFLHNGLPDVYLPQLPDLRLEELPELFEWTMASSLDSLFESIRCKVFPEAMKERIAHLGLPHLTDELSKLSSVCQKDVQVFVECPRMDRGNLSLLSGDGTTEIQASISLDLSAGTIRSIEFALSSKERKVRLPKGTTNLLDSILKIEEQLAEKPVLERRKEFLQCLGEELPFSEVLEYDRKEHTYKSFLVKSRKLYDYRDCDLFIVNCHFSESFPECAPEIIFQNPCVLVSGDIAKSEGVKYQYQEKESVRGICRSIGTAVKDKIEVFRGANVKAASGSNNGKASTENQ